MPRKSRKRMVGKFEDRDRREREKELRQLRRELAQLWRRRDQVAAEVPDTDDAMELGGDNA